MEGVKLLQKLHNGCNVDIRETKKVTVTLKVEALIAFLTYI